MEPLENRIARLTLEQQQEVGDFVDFLLLKNTIRQGVANPSPACFRESSPPVMVPDLPCTQSTDSQMKSDSWSLYNHHSCAPHGEPTPSVIHEIRSGGDDPITREYLDYGSYSMASQPATEMQKKGRPRIIARDKEQKTRHILEWVD